MDSGQSLRRERLFFRIILLHERTLTNAIPDHAHLATMKLKRHFGNLILLAVTAAFCLLLGEGAARLTLRPADYLSVEMVKDDVLGAVPSSFRGTILMDCFS